MNYLKILALLSFFAAMLFAAACDSELKEHPMSASLKRQMEMQNDPKIQARKVTGTIKLSPELSGKVPKSVILFIIVRPDGVQSGPPLAVKRLNGVELPYSYSIGQMDTMLEGIKFEGKINITARLDQDGIAQAGPGDIEGKITAQVGDENRNIVLDHLIPGTPPRGTPGSGGASRVIDKVIPALLAKAQGKTVSGTIEVDPNVVKSIAENSILFVILRKIGKTNGPPLAVQLHEKGELPMKFMIGQGDVVMPDSVVEGKVEVIVRIDQDGNATSSPGDVEGRRYASVGDQNVNIVLDKVIEGSKPPPPPVSAPAALLPEEARRVSGRITVAPALQGKIPENAVLFIFARGQGVRQGPPLVVKLFKGVDFPFEFSLGQKDTMIPGDIFAGAVTITARIDQDASAGASSGDIQGSIDTQVGNKEEVEIVLDNLVGG